MPKYAIEGRKDLGEFDSLRAAVAVWITQSNPVCRVESHGCVPLPHTEVLDGLAEVLRTRAKPLRKTQGAV